MHAVSDPFERTFVSLVSFKSLGAGSTRTLRSQPQYHFPMETGGIIHRIKALGLEDNVHIHSCSITLSEGTGRIT